MKEQQQNSPHQNPGLFSLLITQMYCRALPEEPVNGFLRPAQPSTTAHGNWLDVCLPDLVNQT